MNNNRKGSKRIHNKFKHWSVNDCDCKYCKHYAGKGKPCPLDECCVKDIKLEAKRRETVTEQQAL